jgi:urease accessory protein
VEPEAASRHDGTAQPGHAGGAASALGGQVAASYRALAGRTHVERVRETGSLRLRHPRAAICEAVLVNTAGGIVAGDRLALAFTCHVGAAVTITSAAAEKVYRSDGRESAIAIDLAVSSRARLAWLPQESILFDGARLRRRYEVELAADATFLAAEITIFGRLAHGERQPTGHLRDSWRLRRGGRLVYADETAIGGAIGAVLDRPALAGGARAAAVVLLAAPDPEAALERVRAVLEGSAVSGGASVRDGLLHVRLLSGEPDRLRAATIAVVQGMQQGAMPRSWGC